MRSHTTRFREVRAWRTLTGKCPVCGTLRTRKKSFSNTINPFNKRPDGTPKTYEDVRIDVDREADAWVPDFTCAAGKHKFEEGYNVVEVALALDEIQKVADREHVHPRTISHSESAILSRALEVLRRELGTDLLEPEKENV